MKVSHWICALGVSTVVACQRAAAPASAATELVLRTASVLPDDPGDAAWARAAVFVVPLIPQDMVEPRQLVATTSELRVQALSDGTRAALRLEWSDSSADQESRPAHFSDACALQLPAKVAADIPAPQMGEPGKPVEISYWRAAWQRAVDGEPLTLASLYPNAVVDHYPFEAQPAHREIAEAYAPARALGNDMAGPGSAVQDLVATGPGTLEPRTTGDSQARGRRTATGWAVVISRSLPTGLVPGQRTQVAFAVWQGGTGEVGARKMRTAWVDMLREAQ